ncbi:LytTR family DNA-binding domain-containing protein [Draconibacterium sp. IB214405]|uniref:LytR/AlgR family response regulator transcription factor n=1 Tax=Draconibacterium sp. IB214405 TaxID=3097352 RepID=UPI002A0F0A81|nr:LytTR family DNA-binding domain-containing protein [Draconibacterium sp. IB214405]MDX8338462.1 LytTR family DNA-binding domain-containing protein [Draconibacterium sp. IB214405]
MDKIRVIIADDEEDAIEVLRNLFTDTGKVEVVQEISNPFKIESAVNKLKPDALFLDIEMPGQNGLSLLENIRSYNQELSVVYITAYHKYIKDAIKLNVYSYLLKPVDRQEVAEVVAKLIDLKQKRSTPNINKLKLPVKGGYIYIKPEELLLLEADGNYTRLKTIDEEEYISSYNMGRLLNKLPSSFFRINRGCVLNGEFIYKINKTNNTCLVRLNGGEIEFNVSGAFITEFNRTTK